MKPLEFAWSALQSITKLQPKDVKLLVDEIEYPALESDSIGYVVHLSSPKKQRENLLSLHGMYFDADKHGKASLWRMFRASVYHLSMHTITTDFGIYRDLANGASSINNLTFAISEVEDFAVKGHMKAKWPGLLFDMAYAGALTSHRFRNLRDESLDAKVAANLLSLAIIGKPTTSLGKDLDQELLRLQKVLFGLESTAYNYYYQLSSTDARQGSKSSHEADLIHAKISAVKSVLNFLDDNSVYFGDVPSPPFADNHGSNHLFERSTSAIGGTEDFDSLLREACQAYSLDITRSPIQESEKQVETESQAALEDWEFSLNAMNRLAELHRSVDPTTHLEDFLFPKEDYAEFVRTRASLVGPIKLILDRLRMVRSSIDENQGQLSGFVDMPIALQVVASKSDRNDVFVREELEKKSEAWAILIDSSKSLEASHKLVKEISVCLTEVARELIPNQNSWGCYSFNENMYIIKDFSETYGNATKGRIGGLTSGLKTYLPDAMRVAAKRLTSTNEDIKVMLVASDGFPLGYQGIDDALIETVARIKKSGIQLIGMGVGSSSLKKYFTSNCAANSPFDLMKYFVRTYVELASLF